MFLISLRMHCSGVINTEVGEMMQLNLKVWGCCTHTPRRASTVADSKFTLPLGFDGTMFNSWRGHDSLSRFDSQVECITGGKATLHAISLTTSKMCPDPLFNTSLVAQVRSREQREAFRAETQALNMKGFSWESLSLILVHTFCCRLWPVMLFSKAAALCLSACEEVLHTER